MFESTLNWLALFFNWALITGGIAWYANVRHKEREEERLRSAGALNWLCHMQRLNK